MRALSTGLDTLNLAAKGSVRSEVWDPLAEAKRRAQDVEEADPVDFPVTGHAFLLRPYGVRGYTYWLSSPDFELMLGTSQRFPSGLVQLHSAYLHSVGLDYALRLLEELLRHDLFAGTTSSRSRASTCTRTFRAGVQS